MARKKKFERHCTVCGTSYQYCSQCSDFAHLPRWMDAYCSEDCKDIYNITAGWLNGWDSKEVEVARLTKIDLSKRNKYPQWMQDVIRNMENYQPEATPEAIAKALADTEKDNSEENAPEKKEEKKEDKPFIKKENQRIKYTSKNDKNG